MTPSRIISAALAAWRYFGEYVAVDPYRAPRDLAGEIERAWSDRTGRHARANPIVDGGTVTVTLYDRRVKMGAVIIPKQTNET